MCCISCFDMPTLNKTYLILSYTRLQYWILEPRNIFHYISSCIFASQGLRFGSDPNRNPWLAKMQYGVRSRPASSTTKTDRHDLAEILLKVVLNTINQSTNQSIKCCCLGRIITYNKGKRIMVELTNVSLQRTTHDHP